MRLKQNHRAALNKLANGPRTEMSLTHGSEGLGNSAIHMVRNLEECQALGYCVKIGDDWRLTNDGRIAINTKKQSTYNNDSLYDRAIYVPSTFNPELQRPGCMDYKKYPSMVCGALIPYWA